METGEKRFWQMFKSKLRKAVWYLPCDGRTGHCAKRPFLPNESAWNRYHWAMGL